MLIDLVLLQSANIGIDVFLKGGSFGKRHMSLTLGRLCAAGGAVIILGIHVTKAQELCHRATPLGMNSRAQIVKNTSDNLVQASSVGSKNLRMHGDISQRRNPSPELKESSACADTNLLPYSPWSEEIPTNAFLFRFRSSQARHLILNRANNCNASKRPMLLCE